MSISVIIPTHNRADALIKTLLNLEKQNFNEKWETIVVNNNCTDDTDEVVRYFQKHFPVSLQLVHESKPGASAARNCGVRFASGEYLIFIDNDILVAPDFLARHKAALKKYVGNWIVGQTVNLPEQDETNFGRYRKFLFPVISTDQPVIKTDGFGAANVSMPRKDFELLGGFDENFHVASGEDRELAMRANKMGIKILFEPNIIVVHNDWAGSTIRDFCKRQRTYMQTEAYFWQKYGNENPRMQLVKENLPPDLTRDGFRLYARKSLKSVLGSTTGQSAIIRLCELVEKAHPKPSFLWRLYRLAIAGAIYRGFQEGYKYVAEKKY